MITSREVFAKRKEGAIDEAYKMAYQKWKIELQNKLDKLN